jgi:branched-chain amino acid transport system substrate-binding protein
MNKSPMHLKKSFVVLGLAGLITFTAPAWAQLRIGMPSGFTGSVAAGVKENHEGAKLYFDTINARGGVNGQKIELITVDDKFDPKVTVEVARELVTKQRVLALFLNRGTPHSQALLPVLTELKVPLVGPSTGAMVLHEPVHPWVFNVRATYQREAAKAVEHLASIGITRIAMIETDDSFGADSAAGALKGFAKVNQKPVVHEKSPRDKPDFTDLAKRVNESNAQAVLVIASAGNTANAVKAIRAAGSLAQVVTLSNNASDGFIKLLGEHARGVIVTQVFPNERSVAYPLIKEAQEFAKAKGLPGVSPAMMEGYQTSPIWPSASTRATRRRCW